MNIYLYYIVAYIILIYYFIFCQGKLSTMRITKKLPRKGDDGYRIVSVRMKETLLERLDALSAKSNRSRNELINLLLESAVDIVKIDE